MAPGTVTDCVHAFDEADDDHAGSAVQGAKLGSNVREHTHATSCLAQPSLTCESVEGAGTGPKGQCAYAASDGQHMQTESESLHMQTACESQHMQSAHERQPSPTAHGSQHTQHDQRRRKGAKKNAKPEPRDRSRLYLGVGRLEASGRKELFRTNEGLALRMVHRVFDLPSCHGECFPLFPFVCVVVFRTNEGLALRMVHRVFDLPSCPGECFPIFPRVPKVVSKVKRWTQDGTPRVRPALLP